MDGDELRRELQRLMGLLDISPDSELVPRVLDQTDRARLPAGSSLWVDEGGAYHYRLVDGSRGAVSESSDSSNPYDVLYCAIRWPVTSLAYAYEKEHHLMGADPRRRVFPQIHEMMALLGNEYATRSDRELSEVLERSPYNDEPFIRFNI